MMRLMPWMWRKLEAVAHTLPHDAALMREFAVPRARFAAIRVPTLAMNGSKTDLCLKQAAQAIARYDESMPAPRSRLHRIAATRANTRGESAFVRGEPQESRLDGERPHRDSNARTPFHSNPATVHA